MLAARRAVAALRPLLALREQIPPRLHVREIPYVPRRAPRRRREQRQEGGEEGGPAARRRRHGFWFCDGGRVDGGVRARSFLTVGSWHAGGKRETRAKYVRNKGGVKYAVWLQNMNSKENLYLIFLISSFLTPCLVGGSSRPLSFRSDRMARGFCFVSGCAPIGTKAELLRR